MSLNFCQSDPKISECPSCHTFCERMKESDRCLMCRICTKSNGKAFYFCWDCKQEWIGSPYNKKCGNDACNAEEILNKLKNCPETEIGYLKGLKVPSIRACPYCGSLIQHGGACKHMTCKACTKEFCFVCLRIRDGGSRSCGSYSTQCSVKLLFHDVHRTIHACINYTAVCIFCVWSVSYHINPIQGRAHNSKQKVYSKIIMV